MAAYYDANGHYARVQPVFAPTRFDRDLYKLIGVSPSDRLNPYSRDSRPDCPGGATQPTPDGSAPWAVNGCEPTATPDSEDPPAP